MSSVSPDVQVLVADYLRRRSKEYVELVKAFDKKDYDFIKYITHQIKGHAPSYGFEDLSEIAVVLERGSLEKNDVVCQEALHSFEKWLAANA